VHVQVKDILSLGLLESHWRIDDIAPMGKLLLHEVVHTRLVGGGRFYFPKPLDSSKSHGIQTAWPRAILKHLAYFVRC
jgi:hypothetical protein